MRFGLDLDGVIYDFHSAFRFLANHQFNLNMPRVEEIWDRWSGHLKYMTKEQDDWMWTEGIRRGLFRHGHVRKGAIEFCQELDKLMDIIIITHRPREARQDTLDWLSFHRIPTSEIHMLHAGQNKATVSVDFALDDKPENILCFDEAGVQAVLWDRPWNKHSELRRDRYWGQIGIAYNWEEILRWIKKDRRMTAAN